MNRCKVTINEEHRSLTSLGCLSNWQIWIYCSLSVTNWKTWKWFDLRATLVLQQPYYRGEKFWQKLLNKFSMVHFRNTLCWRVIQGEWMLQNSPSSLEQILWKAFGENNFSFRYQMVINRIRFSDGSGLSCAKILGQKSWLAQPSSPVPEKFWSHILT